MAAALGATPVEALELHPWDTVDGKPHAVGNGRVFVLDDASRVPVLLDGWFRWTSFIQIGGVAAELVQWERGRGAWPAREPAAWTPPPIAPSSVEGRPRWDPPPPVAAARARQGTEAYEHKETLR
jgi:hypothetical protein